MYMSRRVRVKPGKSQSIMGGVMGAIMCGLGIFVAIPVFGTLGVIWTLFAVAMTAVSFINAFSKDGITTHEIIIDDDMTQTKSESSSEDKLKEIKHLYDTGLITKEEFENKKSQILMEI